MSSTAIDRLRHFVSRSTDHSTCDLCRSDLTDRHRHLLEVASRRMLCACDACSLLFSDANGSRFRPIPQSVTRIEMKLTDAQWAGLGIPIGMAYFTIRDQFTSPAPTVERIAPSQATSPAQRGRSDTVAAGRGQTAHAKTLTTTIVVGYPSPAGPVMSSVEHEDWQALIDANPDVGRLRPEVESLLVNRTANRRQSFVVPLDVCFELIGIVRRDWDGFSGGPVVHREIDHFFDQLEQSAVTGVPS